MIRLHLHWFCHQLNILFDAYTIKSEISVHAQIFLKFLDCLVQEKIWIASLTPLTNSNNCSVFRIKFLFLLSRVLLVDFFSVHSYPAFVKIFQDHRRVSEQLLETQVAIRKPEQAFWIGLLEGISKWFHRSKYKLPFCENHKLSLKKYFFDC